MKNINFAQWKAQSVLKSLPVKTEKQEEPKFEELDDFTSLLTKRLFENLDETEVTHGSYTVKEGSYCLIIQQDKQDRKKDDLSFRDVDKKTKHFEEMLPGPCFAFARIEDKKGTFNRDEILRFELQYKDILYDTYIRVGRFYQAYTPPLKYCKAFLKGMVIFGLPPKNSHLLRPPKLTIEYKQKGRRDKQIAPQKPDSTAMDQEDINKGSDDQPKKGSYIHNDDFKGELIVESIYVPRRSLSEYLEWDPEIVKDPEVIDMVGQVLEEFRGDPRVNREVLYDYLKLCRLNKERFLDHLELDHDDFRKYLFMVLHKGN